jgi:hypothetical protein
MSVNQLILLINQALQKDAHEKFVNPVLSAAQFSGLSSKHLASS